MLCALLFYVTVVSLLFLGKIKFLFFIANLLLLSCYFLYSSSINSCDLNHSREIVNWVSIYLIPSITGGKTTAVSKRNRLIWQIALTFETAEVSCIPVEILKFYIKLYKNPI